MNNVVVVQLKIMKIVKKKLDFKMNHDQYQHIIVIYQLKRPSLERLQLLKQLGYSRKKMYDATVKSTKNTSTTYYRNKKTR